jgi:hypothetical protein
LKGAYQGIQDGVSWSKEKAIIDIDNNDAIVAYKETGVDAALGEPTVDEGLF